LLHIQLNTFDSIWAYDVGKHPSPPARLLALGRDRLATGEDNEPTGLHFSDGDSSLNGLLGTKSISSRDGFLFFTRQHGENNVCLIEGDHRWDSNED